MANELKFERETCSRCGGSGRYSYNQIDGDTCFKCHGHREVLTKRAKVAADRLKASRQIRLGDVVPGMRIRSSGATYAVQSVKQDTVSTSSSLKDGVMVANAPSLHIQGIRHGLTAWPDFMVELIPSKAEQIEQLREAIEYQNSLTKTGTVRARKLEAA